VKPSFLKKERRKCVIEKTITVTGVNKGEKLTIDSSKIIYVKASGHYIHLFYFSEQERKIKSRLIRTSMTKFKIDLGVVSSIIRVHKSYYVGLKYVKYIRINSKGGIICLTIKNIKLILSETNKEYVKRHVEIYFKDTIETYL
jgi:DNA-binding LytR/AlgR family response regulator